MEIKKIGIIGFGNMGQAIAEQLKTDYQILVFDKDITKTKNLLGIGVASNSIDLVKQVDTLILAVKPQDFDELLSEIKDYIKDKLIISIAAGITTGYIEKILGQVKVIRAMPNLPAKIGRGMICLCKGKFSNKGEFNSAKNLFSFLGKTLLVRENQMNTVTAISGSGPGFYFDCVDSRRAVYERNRKKFLQEFILLLTKAAKEEGFNSKNAKLLASTTASASEYMVVNSKVTPAELRTQVTSKGGTTEAGLRKLKGNIKNLILAVKAAKKRAKELSKKK